MRVQITTWPIGDKYNHAEYHEVYTIEKMSAGHNDVQIETFNRRKRGSGLDDTVFMRINKDELEPLLSSIKSKDLISLIK